MGKCNIEFIKETLLKAIGWADYAPEYFKEKHNFEQDRINVELCILLLNDFENKTCSNCKWYESYPSVCCNADSPLCADVVPLDYGCNKHENNEKQC